MTKPLHERLREYEKQCDNPFFEFGDGSKGFVTFSTYEASKLADEIERDYRLLPRFKDGPVKFGDEVDQGDYIFTARRINFYENGDVTVCDIGGQGRTYRPGELLERPTPKVCDADGAEIKEDATLYGTGREQHRYTVQKPYSINEEVGERFCVQCYDHDEGNIVWCDPQMLTYREPDSLNKLLEDMMTDKRTRGTSYIPRIQSLIERGA